MTRLGSTLKASNTFFVQLCFLNYVSASWHGRWVRFLWNYTVSIEALLKTVLLQYTNFWQLQWQYFLLYHFMLKYSFPSAQTNSNPWPRSIHQFLSPNLTANCQSNPDTLVSFGYFGQNKGTRGEWTHNVMIWGAASYRRAIGSYIYIHKIKWFSIRKIL